MCAYIHYLNIPLAGAVYFLHKKQMDIQHIYDIGGIFLLSIASYKYHYDIYEKIQTNQIDQEHNVEENSNFVYFLNDCICIHIRSFLAVFTNYYNNPHFYSVSALCAIIHVSCIYGSVINVVELLSKKTYDKSNFLKTHYVFTFTSIGLDISAIFFNMKSQEIWVPYLVVNLGILLLFIVDPFYKLTHVAFHVLLIAQNWYICLSNI